MKFWQEQQILWKTSLKTIHRYIKPNITIIILRYQMKKGFSNSDINFLIIFWNRNQFDFRILSLLYWLNSKVVVSNLRLNLLNIQLVKITASWKPRNLCVQNSAIIGVFGAFIDWALNSDLVTIARFPNFALRLPFLWF